MKIKCPHYKQKTLLCLALCAALVLSFGACGKNGAASAGSAQMLEKLRPYLCPARDMGALTVRMKQESGSSCSYIWVQLEQPVVRGQEKVLWEVLISNWASPTGPFAFRQTDYQEEDAPARDLTEEEAMQLVQRFAADFLPGGENLDFVFENTGTPLETFTAYRDEAKTARWTFHVNMRGGYIEVVY